MWVELSLDEETGVTLMVQDNGRGFPEGNSQSDGIGLSGLRERLMLAGGDLFVSSNPERGTILTARLPLPEAYASRESV